MKKLSEGDLIREHDQAAKSTVTGVSYYLEELTRRRFKGMHQTIRNLTWVILGLTLLNTLFVALATFRP